MTEAARKVRGSDPGAGDDRLRRLLETTRAIPWEADARTWEFTYVGPQAAEILGYPVERWYEKDFWVEHMHPSDRSSAADYCARMSWKAPDYEFEYRMFSADGRVVWIHDVVHVEYADAVPEKLRGFMIDITERKQAEVERREEEERFRAVAQSSADIIYDFNARSERINWIGDIDGQLGYEPGGFPRDLESWKGKVHPDDLADTMKKVEYHLSTGEDVAFEYRIRCKDGSYRNWDVRGKAIRFEDGRPTRWVGACTDVTDRKSAEHELRLRLSAIEAANDGILIVDARRPGLPIIYASPSFTRLTGYSKEELLGDTCTRLQGPDTDPGVIARIVKTFQQGIPFEGEVLNYRKDGTAFWNELRIVPVRNEAGEVTHFVGTQNDVSEGKQARESIRTLGARLIHAQEEERRRIARELHDDLNQRLALLAIELEELGQKPPRGAEAIRRRMKALWERTQELSSDVHRLSHQLHPSKLEQLGLVAAVRSVCGESEKQDRIKITFSAGAVPRSIPLDVSLAVYRVAQEALRNTVKHSGAKRVEVRVESTGKDLRLRVADSGCGFDPAAARGKGGLGLLGMDERLRLVGGTLSVDSRPGEGTRIEVSIPLEECGGGGE